MPGLRFTLPEFAGSLADLGTIIPFVLAAVLFTDMKLGPILLAFGLFYIASGLIYRLPMAVEPMKVVGAISVSAGLTHGEIIGAGLFVGLFFLLLGLTGLIGLVEKYFPLSLIRGVQLGLALLLLLKGGQYVTGDWQIGLLAVAIYLVILLADRMKGNLGFLGAIAILALGIGYGIWKLGVPPVRFGLPLDLYLPTSGELVGGAYKAGVAQVPLTLTNAVLATSLLASDLFKAKVSNRKLSLTIGTANVIATPLGGFPMCHGAGGMAAHYKFGARTGGADVMIGALFVLASFFATSALLKVFPLGVLGVLLFFAGFELLRSAVKTDHYLITGIMGVVTLLVDPTVGLAVGIVLFLIYWSVAGRKKGTGHTMVGDTKETIAEEAHE